MKNFLTIIRSDIVISKYQMSLRKNDTQCEQVNCLRSNSKKLDKGFK